MKKRQKRNIDLFLRSFGLSFVICLCLFILVYGTAKSYENIRLLGFGEYKSAAEITDNGLRLLDFEIRLF